MTQKTYFTATGTVFFIIAALHALRLLFGLEVFIGDFTIPLWFSIIGLLLAGYFSFTALKLSR